MRSTLVTQELLDECITLLSDEVQWGRMWIAFFDKEELLSNWAGGRHDKMAQDLIDSYNLPGEIAGDIIEMLDAAIMTGLYFGGRRLELQRGESDWISESFDMPSKDPGPR